MSFFVLKSYYLTNDDNYHFVILEKQSKFELYKKYLKILIPLFIVFSIALRPLLPLFEYAVNYKQISTEFCIYKNNFELSCNGKCYLMKELAKSSYQLPKQNQKPGNIFTNLPDNFVVAELFSFNYSSLKNTSNKKKTSHTNSRYVFSLNSKIFHPPLIGC